MISTFSPYLISQTPESHRTKRLSSSVFKNDVGSFVHNVTIVLLMFIMYYSSLVLKIAPNFMSSVA